MLKEKLKIRAEEKLKERIKNFKDFLTTENYKAIRYLILHYYENLEGKAFDFPLTEMDEKDYFVYKDDKIGYIFCSLELGKYIIILEDNDYEIMKKVFEILCDRLQE